MIWYHMIDRKNLKSTYGDHIKWWWNEGDGGDGLMEKCTSLDERKERWECKYNKEYTLLGALKEIRRYQCESVGYNSGTMGNPSLPSKSTNWTRSSNQPTEQRWRKKNGRTQCMSLSRTTSTTILALEKPQEGRMHLEKTSEVPQGRIQRNYLPTQQKAMISLCMTWKAMKQW